MPSREILIETRRIGAIVSVRAMDAATGTEISFQAPAATSRLSLQRLAASKIAYVLSKSGNFGG